MRSHYLWSITTLGARKIRLWWLLTLHPKFWATQSLRIIYSRTFPWLILQCQSNAVSLPTDKSVQFTVNLLSCSFNSITAFYTARSRRQNTKTVQIHKDKTLHKQNKNNMMRKSSMTKCWGKSPKLWKKYHI